MLEFQQCFPNEKAAEKYLERLRWGTCLFCPYCGNYDSDSLLSDTSQKPHFCCECDKHFSVRSGTIMASSRLSLYKWLLAIYLLTLHPEGISSQILASELKITQKSAWHLAHQILSAFKQGAGLFSQPVNVKGIYKGDKKRKNCAGKQQSTKPNLINKQTIGCLVSI